MISRNGCRNSVVDSTDRKEGSNPELWNCRKICLEQQQKQDLKNRSQEQKFIFICVSLRTCPGMTLIASIPLGMSANLRPGASSPGKR